MSRQSWLLAVLVLTILSTSVKAVHLNTDGSGQIALLPYYTVNNNFITNLTITNTTELYKAVKVRFHESRIGAEYGVWTGVPVIGFSAMAADLGPSQLGEVVELYRSVNRN
ncbi:hypothetical protein [Candidatus Thiodiazotropha sp. CDECU1]|uniref:hypothetical protein n=1 Tax=Candidatus Thiodiazotropha sp. CDECU1 TaxID=3065865 RepID=UPI00292F71B9|nr:hypothetical protein [Candidatus Thiodiazotropha sp. CDECU1]